MNVYVGNRLPSAYQEVEYIQSSGTQFINTGVINHWSTLNINMKFLLTELQTGVEDGIFGAKYSSSNQAPVIYTFADSSKMLASWAGSGTSVSITSATANTEYSLDFTFTTSSRSWKLNGVSGSSSTGVSNSANNRDGYMALFADGSNPSGYSKLKLYYCKITVNGTLVRNFVPCYRKSDTVIGLYDLVNNQFYTNSGTGTFSKGSDVLTNATLKNAYIGEVYEYSYDFRNKTESQIYNDGWSKFRGSVQINSIGITAPSNTDLVLTHPADLSSANKITVQASIVFNSADTGYAVIHGLSSTATPQQNNAVFYIASIDSYGGTRTRIATNGTTSEGTNVGGIGKSSYTPYLIIDLTNKTINGIVDGKTSTYTLTDTQVSNIRNLNGIYLYCTQANFYISDVKLTVE